MKALLAAAAAGGADEAELTAEERAELHHRLLGASQAAHPRGPFAHSGAAAPVAREYILRCAAPLPTPSATPTNQRLFASLHDDQWRVAVALAGDMDAEMMG